MEYRNSDGIPGSQPSRSLLRKMIDDTLLADNDLNAFCIDYFPEVVRKFTNGMERTQKINILLIYVPTVELCNALHRHHINNSIKQIVYGKVAKIEKIFPRAMTIPIIIVGILMIFYKRILTDRENIQPIKKLTSEDIFTPISPRIPKIPPSIPEDYLTIRTILSSIENGSKRYEIIIHNSSSKEILIKRLILTASRAGVPLHCSGAQDSVFYITNISFKQKSKDRYIISGDYANSKNAAAYKYKLSGYVAKNGCQDFRQLQLKLDMAFLLTKGYSRFEVIFPRSFHIASSYYGKPGDTPILRRRFVTKLENPRVPSNMSSFDDMTIKLITDDPNNAEINGTAGQDDFRTFDPF